MKKSEIKSGTKFSSAKEMKLLLDISKSITTIRDKNELWKVMIEKIEPVLKFKASVSTIYSADYSQYNYFLYSDSVTEKIPTGLKDLLGVYLPIKNTSDEWVFNQGDISTLTMYEKETIANANPEAIKILKAAGIEFSLYIKLRVGGKVIGVQHYHFTDKNIITKKIIAFAKSITDLIAMAVGNILANEEILEKAKEIEGLNKQLQVHNEYLIEEVEQHYNFEEMIGQNTRFAEVCRSIGLVSKTDSSVLVLGETGTGKNW